MKGKSSVTLYCHYFDIFVSKFNFKSDYACILKYLELTTLFQSDDTYLFKIHLTVIKLLNFLAN